MTAKIVPFPNVRAATLLRDFTRQSDEVSNNLGDMRETLDEMQSKLDTTGEMVAAASDDIRRTHADFDASCRLYRECVDALESGSIEAMEEMAERMRKRR